MATAIQQKTVAGERATSSRSLCRRVALTVGWLFLIVGSLLTFPSGIPWMMAVWLAACSLAAVRRGSTWYWLLACLLILVVKWPYCPTSLIAMGGLLAVAAAVELACCLRKRGSARVLRFAAILALWSVWVWLVLEWQAVAQASRPIKLHSDRPVVCIGDSLTSGIAPYGGYPADLQPLLPVRVINLGQAGITSHEALESLPELQAAEPQVVVIELGGHDYLRGRPRAETMSDLETLIAASRAAGADVVLMEIPRGFITDPYRGLERELAHRHDLELISDSAIRNLVLWSPSAPPGMWVGEPYLSDDGLHPNNHGNAYLARRVAAVVESAPKGKIPRPR